MTSTRPLTSDDLDPVIALWHVATAPEAPPLFGAADAVRAVTDGCPTVGAFVAGELVGTAVAKVEGDRAWLLRWVMHPEHRRQGIGGRLLDELLREVRAAGVDRVLAVLPPGEAGGEAFAARGFMERNGVRWFQRSFEPVDVSGPAAQLGAESVDEAAWDQVAGMREVKDLIERRVVMPLADPDQAAVHGVQPPRAIILFGPPGTGKTTFAKAVAGRLGWPFVELRPSALTDGGRAGQASRLRSFFSTVEAMDPVLVFIDEVEDIAAQRGGDPERHAITNELLKLIPGFRSGPRRLLVCATNAIGDLDPALVRPGRFDYLLPVGPPDREAREAIWNAYLSRAKGAERLDLGAIADASSGATPADIEFASRKAAQRSFERAVLHDDHTGITTDDVLTVWDQVGPSLDRETLRGFEDDTDRYTRV